MGAELAAGPRCCVSPSSHGLSLQGKTVIQAEIDAAAELIDFFRFNAKYALELEQSQPLSVGSSTNSMVYRGLEVSPACSAPPWPQQGSGGSSGAFSLSPRRASWLPCPPSTSRPSGGTWRGLRR